MVNLGVNPEDEVSNAWSNPITTHILHHSHVESLVGMCAKRFEFEFVQLLPRQPTPSDIRMHMGTAGHEVVEQVLNGSAASLGTIIDTSWEKNVQPYVYDPALANKLADEYQKNVEAAISWVSDNLNYRQVNSEMPFLIPNVNKLSPHLNQIAADWKFAGKIDLVEFDDVNSTAKIIDLKFREKSQYDRNKKSSQSAMYSLAAMHAGYVPQFQYVEIIKGRIVEQKIEITEGKIDWLFIKARQAIGYIEAGNYPISPNGWWCDKRYCQFFSVCRGKYEPDDEE